MRSAEDLLADLAVRGISITREEGALRVRGPVGAVTPRLRQEMAERKAEIREHLAGREPPLKPRPDPTLPVPLAPNQRRLWFLDALDDGGTAFVMTAAWIVDGPLEIEALEAALAALVARHTVLRSLIRTEADGPVLVDPSPSSFALELEDESGADPDPLASREASRPFRLEEGPPFRARLSRLGASRHLLILSVHHMVSDRWSMGILFRDLAALYRQAVTGVPTDLPTLPIQFADYAAWQHTCLDEERLAPQVDYWRRQLREAPTDLALPLDRPRPPTRGDRSDTVRFSLPAETAAKLLQVARAEAATPFMALLTVYAALLSRYSGQDELVIGCPAGGRDRMETQELIGFFVNNLALRADLTDAPDFASLVRRLRTVCLEAFAHQEVPFDRVVEALQPERALNRGPLFQAMFVLQTANVAPLELHGLQATRVESAGGAPELDLNLSLESDGGGFIGYLEYDCQLFDRTTAERLASSFVALSEAAAAAPGVPIPALVLAGRHEPLAVLTGRIAESPPGSTVVDLICKQAADSPEAIAVVQGETAVSFAELERASRVLALRLEALGVGRDVVVGVATEPSPQLVVALLAVLRAGGAYAVINTAQPVQRLVGIVSDAGINLLIGPVEIAGRLPEGLRVIDPLGDQPNAESGELSRAPAPDDLAYVSFTSGSTGVPKGAAIEHRGLLNHALAVVRDFGLKPGDRVLQFAAPEFDVAAEEIYPTLLAGATLVIRPGGAVEALQTFTADVDADGITVLNLPAPFWHAWVRHLCEISAAPPLGLRLLVTGSDRVDAELLADWQELAGERVSWRNGYGPTEATITATFFDPAEDSAPSTGVVPIGRPIDNVRVAIVDGLGLAVPAGVVGEIVIGGPGVARGYLNRTEETAASFRPDPFAPPQRNTDDRRLAFWTGDLGRWRPDGTVEFIGRRDDQVKIRGFRVEPGEVAATLGRHPAVAEAAVLALPDRSGQKRLVAFARSAGGEAAALPLAELRGWLQGVLPGYMVPAKIVPMEQLPRTSAGKLDRRALAALDPGDISSQGNVAPRNATESKLAAIFAGVLGVPQVGAFDSFFDLGGDSIRSLQIVSRAREQGLVFSVRQVFQHPTVAALSSEVREAGTSVCVTEPGDGPVPVTPIQAWFHSEVIEEPHHYNQAVLLEAPEDLDEAALARALRALLEHHEALRLRVEHRGAQVTQVIPPPGPGDALEILSFVDRSEAREPAFAAAQRKFDLARGPLLRAVLVRPDRRLLMVAHHLAVDAVSWLILLDDLRTAYAHARRQEEPVLPHRTTPFRVWAERLAALAATDDPAAEVDFQRAALNMPAATLFSADSRPGEVGDAARLTADLEQDATTVVLARPPVGLAVRPDAVLLAALLRAARRLTGSDRLRVDIERHGRADIFPDLDLSRTVGWFTAVHPLVLEHIGPPDARAEIGSIARQLNNAPRNGLDFGLVRYASPNPELRAATGELVNAQLLVNYLGSLDSADADESFPVVDESVGPTLSPRARRSHVVELNAGVRGGRLHLDFTFPAGDAAATATALCEATTAALHELAAEAALDVDPAEALPLTALQQGILAHSLRDPDTYFEQLRMELEGPLDSARLREAWQAALQRHEATRATFHWRDVAQPVQLIAPRLELPWREEDWRAIPDSARAARMDELLAADRSEGFELDRPPLMRVHLVRTADTSHQLIWSAHHLLMDGWSVSVLLREVFELYRAAVAGAAPELAAAPSFADYLRRLEIRQPAEAAAFWRDELAGIAEPTPVALPGLAPDPTDVPLGTHADLHLRLTESETQALRGLARRDSVTLGTILQGAWALLLHRYSGRREVLFGVTVSGRPPSLAGSEDMVGMLINTVPVRVEVPDGEAASDWLRRLLGRHLERDRFGDMPLVEIARVSEISSGIDLFQSIILFQNYPSDGELAGGGVTLTGFQAYEHTSFPLTLSCAPGRELAMALHYDTRLFSSSAIRRMLNHVRNLLAALAATPGAPVAKLDMLGWDERASLLAVGRGSVEPPNSAFAHELVDTWAERRPAAPALIGHDATLDYRTLSSVTDALAGQLGALGIRVGMPVGLCLTRSTRLVTALVAIWKAGGAALPLDPAYPVERLRFMIEDSGTSLIVSESSILEDLPDMGTAVLDLDDCEELLPAVPARPRLEPSAIAYVIYTSGSTGTPKGVESTHGGLRGLIHAHRSQLGVASGDRVLQFASPSFDASVWEIVMALGAGATLLLPAAHEARPGSDLARFLVERRVTVATLPPTSLAVMPEELLPDLGLLIVAGEACQPALARRWSAGRRFVNAYGPTECSVCATLDEGGGDGARLPIGRPLPNLQAHLLDALGRPVPIGIHGELHLGGAGLARGYLSRPALTGERFVPHPWGALGERLYRTGDVAYRLEDGRIQFVGRADDQVKLRGFRIELGEVETVLAKHPSVRGVTAAVRNEKLIAYAARAEGDSVDESALRAFLRDRLPEHMVPARVVVLSALPLTPNGKVDRGALPDPDDVALSKSSGRGASSQSEGVLLRIWQEVLGVDRVSVDDAFFDLGGDSILAIQVVARANQEGVPITLDQILTQGEQSIATLIELVDKQPAEELATSSESLEEVVLVPLTPIQLWFFELDAPDPHHYNQALLLEVPADLDPARLERAAMALMRRHDALRLRFARTPTGWVQRLTPPGESFLRVGVHELGSLVGEAAREAIEATAAAAQSGFDLETGPLIRLELLRLGAERPARLLVAVHHLCVDAVSWRPLIEDLFSAYEMAAAGEARLPRHGTSFLRLAQEVTAPAARSAAHEDLAVWTKPRPRLARLPLLESGDPARSTVGESVVLERVFDEEATEMLLRHLPRHMGSQIEGALLTALAAATSATLGGEAVLVDLEGHGRDASLPGIDLTQTVGWFTTIAPVVLPAPPPGRFRAGLEAVREALGNRPTWSLGFGLLRYLSTDPEAREAVSSLEPAQIAFNYLGQWDRSFPAAVPVRLALESEGPCFAASTPRPYLLEVNALVIDGRLRVEWSHDPRLLDSGVVEQLDAAFEGALGRLSALLKAKQPDEPAMTGRPYPLAPQQASMLEHALERPESKAYVVQFRARLTHGLRVSDFQAAWQDVLARHSALRASFRTAADGQARQYFAEEVQAPWRHEDWSAIDPTEVDTRLDAMLIEDCRDGFEPAEAPLMRFALVRTREDWRFHWTHHHLLMDGWSMPILLNEVCRTYDSGEAPEQPAPDFRDYLVWLGRQDKQAARAFWAAELHGFRSPQWPSHRGNPERSFAEIVREPPSELGRALASYASKNQLTVPAVVMGCWALQLARYSESPDVVFGVTSAVRPPELAGIEAMVGPLINTLPLTVTLPVDEPLPRWFGAIHRRRAAQIAHAHLPLSAVVEAAGIAIRPAPFSTTLRIQNYPTPRNRGAGLHFGSVTMIDRWHYPLNLEVVPGEAPVLALCFDTASIDAGAADRLLTEFAALLLAVAQERWPRSVDDQAIGFKDNVESEALPKADRPSSLRLDGGNGDI